MKRGMDRREFLQRAALTGLAVLSPSVLARTARAQAAPYDGPFWIFINANGGWDPTDLCDPKGRANEGQRDPVNTYLTGDILQNGNITFAPHEGQAEFLAKYASRMTVIRGIDLSTNGHGEGLRHSFSGKLPDGNPSLAALIAATYAPQLPTSYLTAGGYDTTNGLVGATRIGNPAVLQQIAFPNQINPQEQLQMGQNRLRTFQNDKTISRIERFRADRLNEMMASQRLPRLRASMNEMYTAGLDQDTLKKVSEFMPSPLSRDRFESQAQIAMAAYKAGASISMSMGFGGFDTHGNHDASHIPQLAALLKNVDFLWDEADRLGIADRVVMMMTSEMGRTPHYNSGNGKDHWSITSAILMGKGIPGNRVIGATTDGVEAMKLDPATLQPIDPKSNNGFFITPTLIHDNLRRMAGVKEAYRREFPLDPDIPEVNLFA
jgi:Protein of unknown function (DUF1501)